MQFATRGDRQSPAILFFHAMGVTGVSSEPVARYLQQNYYCILPTSSVYCAGQKYSSKADGAARKIVKSANGCCILPRGAVQWRQESDYL